MFFGLGRPVGTFDALPKPIPILFPCCCGKADSGTSKAMGGGGLSLPEGDESSEVILGS